MEERKRDETSSAIIFSKRVQGRWSNLKNEDCFSFMILLEVDQFNGCLKFLWKISAALHYLIIIYIYEILTKLVFLAWKSLDRKKNAVAGPSIFLLENWKKSFNIDRKYHQNLPVWQPERSSEIIGLCLMKLSSEMLQNILEIRKPKYFFFILSNFGLVTVDVGIDQGIHC